MYGKTCSSVTLKNVFFVFGSLIYFFQGEVRRRHLRLRHSVRYNVRPTPQTLISLGTIFFSYSVELCIDLCIRMYVTNIYVLV